jgi:hypothetical protein
MSRAAWESKLVFDSKAASYTSEIYL